ncbi:MAG: IPT/TIG domain-containing protein, partial [Bacteroidota bacterium]
YTQSAADLHLQLGDYQEVDLTFQLQDFYDETDAGDAIYFSDNAGAQFTKVYQIEPEVLNTGSYYEIQLDVDSLAALHQLRLSDEFIIRFQQGGSGDFSTYSNEDGLFIDAVQVRGSSLANAPKITSFSPSQGQPGTLVSISGENFSPEDRLFFNQEESQTVNFINSQSITAVVPPLANSGRLKLLQPEAQALSQDSFTVEGQAVVFFEDFESGGLRSMWSASSSLAEGRVEVIQESDGLSAAQEGFYGLVMSKRSDAGGLNVNALDLALPLGSYVNRPLALSFFIKDFTAANYPEDGLYLSDDGGATFSKVYDFDCANWTDEYGQLPEFDLLDLSQKAGLLFNDQFVIRFQKAGIGDLNTYSYNDGLFLDNILIRERSLVYAPLPFKDGFESPTLSPAWQWKAATATSQADNTRPGGWVGTTDWPLAVHQGLRSLFLGRRNDGAFTTNALDLHLNLMGQSHVFLDFWIKDFYEDTHVEDAIYFSDDGGQSFSKVLSLNGSYWADHYGQFPPIPINELALQYGLQVNEQFVIRFQQGGTGDFNTYSSEDGLFLDEVAVYSKAPLYATLPFNDGFESGQLSASWRQAYHPQTVHPLYMTPNNIAQVYQNSDEAFEGAHSLLLGRSTDGNLSSAALDLFLNLQDYSQATLRFQMRDFYDENQSADALYFSDNGGQTFQKVYQFYPEFTPNQYVEYIIDIDSMATCKNLSLSDQFVIRFQQFGQGDFNTYSSEDGFFIDNVSVEGSQGNEQLQLTAFSPMEGLPGTEVDISGRHFSPDMKVYFNQQEALEYTFINEERLKAIVPPLASTGRIRLSKDQEHTVSTADFVIQDQEVLFFEDFETGTLRSAWTTGSSTSQGRVDVIQQTNGVPAAYEGWYGALLGKASDDEGYNISYLDLSIPLSAYQGSDLALSFFIKDYYDETHPEDGIYLSDDGGQNFVKVIDFNPSNWTDYFGQMPPFDLDQLTQQAGLQFTDDFVIRFQQAGNGDVNTYSVEDGIFLDNIKIEKDPKIYAQLPFEDGFEQGTLGKAWQRAFPDSTADNALVLPGARVEVDDFDKVLPT